MPALRDNMSMWQVSFYESRHHTNPLATVYVKAVSRSAAIRAAMDADQLQPGIEFERLDIDEANWKYEEEFCTPWQRTELP